MSTPMLTDFLKALREADLKISPAETLEAHRALDLVGIQQREMLRDTLAVVLAKSEDEKDRYDACFDRFFAFDSFSEQQLRDDAEEGDGDGNNDDGDGADQPREENQVGDGAGQSDAAPDDSSDGMPGQGNEGGDSQGSGEGEGQGAGGQGIASQAELQRRESLSELSQMLLEGDRPALQARLAEAAQDAGLRNIMIFTQIGQYTRRIAENMGLNELDQDLAQLRSDGLAGDRSADGMGRRLSARREQFFNNLRDYVEQQLALQAAGQGRRLREEMLEKLKLNNIERRDYEMMRDLVRKMAKKLVMLHSRRRKVANRGQLDVRRTLRKNQAYDGLIFEPQWRRTKIDRPDVFVLCDVSGSVAAVARFLLIFLYSLQEILPRVRAFAFSGELREITDLFAGKGIEEAVNQVLDDFAYSPTDYGRSLLDFRDIALDDVDYKSTVIILGDARSNNSDPQVEIIKTLYDRSKRLIFLNPEAENQWGTGDSEMLRYKPHTHAAEVCNSLRHLERVVDKLLRTSL